MLAAGFSSVYALWGGRREWQAAQYPVEVFRGKDARCPGCGDGLEKIRVSDRSAYCRPKDQQG